MNTDLLRRANPALCRCSTKKLWELHLAWWSLAAGEVSASLRENPRLPFCSSAALCGHLRFLGLPPRSVSLQSMPPHDLQEARMVRETERTRGLRHVPVVALESGDDDLTLGLRLEL